MECFLSCKMLSIARPTLISYQLFRKKEAVYIKCTQFGDAFQFHPDFRNIHCEETLHLSTEEL